MINCRGLNNRLEILEKYDVVPVANLKLLNGDEIKSCANDIITDHYYIFECTLKTDVDKKELIYCGQHVAKDFSKLLDKPLPRLYNILQDEVVDNNISNISTNDDKTSNNILWNKERKQLYNAVMLFFIYWKIKPNTAIYDIKNKLEQYISYPPYLNHIKSVNTIIKSSGKTLDEIIKELESRGNNIKEFKFDLIINRLLKERVKQYFIEEKN